MNTAVIATTPEQMQVAQPRLIEWADNRVAAVRRELSVAEQLFNSLHKAGLRTQPAQTQIRNARRRISFYEKVAAAQSQEPPTIAPADLPETGIDDFRRDLDAADRP